MSWSSAVLATSPYLFWRIGEASGTSGADASGNGRLATYASITLGQASLVPSDATNTAGLVNNVNDQISAAAAVSFSSIDFSAMVIVKEASAVIGGLFASGTQNYLNIGGTNFQAIIDSTSINLSYPVASVFDGNAHVLIYIVKATSVELWVDGVMVASASHSKTGTTRTTFQLKRGSAGPAAGIYDEIALWTSGLTSGQIASIQTAFTGMEVKTVTGTVDLALALEGHAVQVKPVTGAVDLALALEGHAVQVKPVTGTIDLNLTLEGHASSVDVREVTGTIDLGLTLEGHAEMVIPSTGYAAYLGSTPVTVYAGDQPAFFG